MDFLARLGLKALGTVPPPLASAIMLARDAQVSVGVRGEQLKDATSASPKKKRRITTEDDEDEWSGPVGVEYPGF